LHLGTVVWTINLAYLLKHFQFEFEFFTICKQISANYQTDIFSLQQDAPEIDTFHKALALAQTRVVESQSNGIPIFEKEVTQAELREKITHGHVAIMLINSLHFACLECQPELFNNHTFCSLPVTGTPYRGHYILVCGYNTANDVYVFMKPSASVRPCYIPASTLEKSWKSYGTQQNMVLVNLSCYLTLTTK